MKQFTMNLIEGARMKWDEFFNRTEVQDFIMWVVIGITVLAALGLFVVPWVIGLGMYIKWMI